MITIDIEKCNGCGLCIADCIQGNITIESGKATVLGLCILCGHCIAICPQKAVGADEYNMSDSIEYNPELFDLDPGKLLRAMRYRRSVRRFTDEPLNSAEITHLIEAGRHAPTGANKQDVRFIIVQDRLDEFRDIAWVGFRSFVDDLIEKGHPKASYYLNYITNHESDPSKDRLFLGAGTVIIVASDLTLNAGIAATYIELMAAAMGLGALFNHYLLYSILFSEKAREWLDLGEKKPEACLLLGHHNIQYQRTAPRRDPDVIFR